MSKDVTAQVFETIYLDIKINLLIYDLWQLDSVILGFESSWNIFEFCSRSLIEHLFEFKYI